MPGHNTRKRLRRKVLAALFGVNDRTVDGWAKRGILPPPHYLEGSPIPFWWDDEIENLPTVSQSGKAT